jgi:hypothetical protein
MFYSSGVAVQFNAVITNGDMYWTLFAIKLFLVT